MRADGKMDVCYNVQTAAGAKHKLLADFEAANQGNDKNLITPMARSVQEALGAESMAVVADGGYESIQDIISARGLGVDVHVAGTDFDICVPAEEGGQSEITAHHNGRRVYIAGRNTALCPMGKVLYPVPRKKGKKRAKDAAGRFKRQVPMAEERFSKKYNEEGLAVKQIRIKPDKALIAQRKCIAEHPFGTIKRGMDTGYCLMNGK